MFDGEDCWPAYRISVSVIRFSDCLSNHFIRVVTPLELSDLYPITAGVGVPQGAIWSPALFNLYIHQLPTVVKHSLIVRYADDHTLFLINLIMLLLCLN